MATSETGRKLGPTGRRTARNLKELRGRVPVRELSQRLTMIDRPILPSGITKIEQGHRRVDADDLVALAMALGVSPNRLLLDPEADDAELALTDAFPVTRSQAWDWATGRWALPDVFDERRSPLPADREMEFRRANRPNEPKPETTPLKDLVALGPVLRPVVDAIRAALGTGAVTFDQVLEYLDVWSTLNTTKWATADTDPGDLGDKPKATRSHKSATPKGG
jgi:transcriptional regulator with XRE-family HTH domain